MHTDRENKRQLYQRKAVPEYWIVDVDARAFERWRPGDESAEILTGTLEWQPDRFVRPLAIDLPAYFDRVTGARRR